MEQGSRWPTYLLSGEMVVAQRLLLYDSSL